MKAMAMNDLSSETGPKKKHVGTMLIAFFKYEGIVHHKYVPREYYIEIIKQLRDAFLLLSVSSKFEINTALKTQVR